MVSRIIMEIIFQHGLYFISPIPYIIYILSIYHLALSFRGENNKNNVISIFVSYELSFKDSAFIISSFVTVWNNK